MSWKDVSEDCPGRNFAGWVDLFTVVMVVFLVYDQNVIQFLSKVVEKRSPIRCLLTNICTIMSKHTNTRTCTDVDANICSCAWPHAHMSFGQLQLYL